MLKRQCRFSRWTKSTGPHKLDFLQLTVKAPRAGLRAFTIVTYKSLQKTPSGKLHYKSATSWRKCEPTSLELESVDIPGTDAAKMSSDVRKEASSLGVLVRCLVRKSRTRAIPTPDFVARPLPEKSEPPPRQFSLKLISNNVHQNERAEDNDTPATYQNLVFEYTARQIGFLLDGLNVVKGCLNVLSACDPKTWIECIMELRKASSTLPSLELRRPYAKGQPIGAAPAPFRVGPVQGGSVTLGTVSLGTFLSTGLEFRLAFTFR